MAKSYLDKTGLAYFWGKIKSYFMRRNLVPEQTKTYTGVIASANSDPAGYLYFGSLKPVDYNTPWRIRYRMYITIGGLSSRNKSYFDVEMRGMTNTYWGYDVYNQVDTSYRPLYYHLLYTCTSAGITSGYGHLIGIRLQSSYNPATAANARTVDVQIIDTENCVFTFFDTMKLYEDVPGTGSTNYSIRNQFNGFEYGHKMAGDANSQGQLMYHYNNIKTKAAITNPSLIVGDADGYCRVGSGVTFDIAFPILWCTAALNANVQNYANVFTRQYDLNIASGAKTGFTSSANKMIYLVVTISGQTATIDSSIITDTLPSTDDGKVYILLGHLGMNSSGANYFILYEVHPMFVYKNGSIRQWMSDASTVSGHTVEKDVPANAVFTDTVTTATTSGSGNAVTAITASNGALTVTKGTTFLTSHQDISGKADKSATVSTVAWDSTNKKLTKTINGSTTDVVTAATLRTGLNVADGAEVNQNAFSNVKVGSTTVSADSKTDTLELAAGTNITLTPDATNDKVTIATSAEVNQNAFSNVKVGSTTVAADSKTDTLELAAGSNVTLTPDATNDKVTIAATDTTYSAGTGLSLSGTTFSNSGVTGVKGYVESSYRTGNVNLTADDVYAIRKYTDGNTLQLTRSKYKNGAGDNTLDGKIRSLRANRLAFLPADQIIIEKTTDGGTTWTDAGVADAVKESLFAETRPTTVAIPLLNGVKSLNCGIRVTFTAMKYNVPTGTSETQKYNYWNSQYINSAERYCQLKEMYFFVSSNSDTISVKLERAKGDINNHGWVTSFEQPSWGMTGWSGSDYIRFDQNNFGGSTSQISNWWNYRLTFMTRGVNGTETMATTYTTAAQTILEIRGYGDTYWTKGCEYAAEDKMYTHDYLKNVTFPAKVNATEFVGKVNATEFVGGTLGVDHGGTGKTTAKDAANVFMNALDTGASTPADGDYYISQYVNGGTTTTTYHRRPMSALWAYIQSKISSVLGLTSSAYGGTSAKATADASGNTITSYYAPKSTAVTNVALATNKITKTINGTTTDVVTSATTSAYGITKLSSATNSTATDLAATPSAVKTAYDLANTANGTANTALSGVNGTLIYDHTYTISNGVATFTAHVYQKGVEVTSSYADSAFSWSYRLDSNISGTPSVVSLGTGKTKTVTLSTLGYGGHIIGTFTT